MTFEEKINSDKQHQAVQNSDQNGTIQKGKPKILPQDDLGRGTSLRNQSSRHRAHMVDCTSSDIDYSKEIKAQRPVSLKRNKSLRSISPVAKPQNFPKRKVKQSAQKRKKQKSSSNWKSESSRYPKRAQPAVDYNIKRQFSIGFNANLQRQGRMLESQNRLRSYGRRRTQRDTLFKQNQRIEIESDDWTDNDLSESPYNPDNGQPFQPRGHANVARGLKNREAKYPAQSKPDCVLSGTERTQSAHASSECELSQKQPSLAMGRYQLQQQDILGQSRSDIPVILDQNELTVDSTRNCAPTSSSKSSDQGANAQVAGQASGAMPTEQSSDIEKCSSDKNARESIGNSGDDDSPHDCAKAECSNKDGSTQKQREARDQTRDGARGNDGPCKQQRQTPGSTRPRELRRGTLAGGGGTRQRTATNKERLHEVEPGVQEQDNYCWQDLGNDRGQPAGTLRNRKQPLQCREGYQQYNLRARGCAHGQYRECDTRLYYSTDNGVEEQQIFGSKARKKCQGTDRRKQTKRPNRWKMRAFSPGTVSSRSGGVGTPPPPPPSHLTPDHIDMSVSWDQIGGLDSLRNTLWRQILLPLIQPQLFQSCGLQMPRGVLLYGPPGTGKTLMLKALVADVYRQGYQVRVYSVITSDIISKYVGEAERSISALFAAASANAPSIIIIDEIDALIPVRSLQTQDSSCTISSTLLTLMDGLRSKQHVVLIGTTNRIDMVDPAFRRPGRFDAEFSVPLPDLEARRTILRTSHARMLETSSANVVQQNGSDTTLARDTGVARDAEHVLEGLEDVTQGFSGADVAYVVQLARQYALEREMGGWGAGFEQLPKQRAIITRTDVTDALAAIMPRVQRMQRNTATPLPNHLVPLLTHHVQLIMHVMSKTHPCPRATSHRTQSYYVSGKWRSTRNCTMLCKYCCGGGLQSTGQLSGLQPHGKVGTRGDVVYQELQLWQQQQQSNCQAQQQTLHQSLKTQTRNSTWQCTSPLCLKTGTVRACTGGCTVLLISGPRGMGQSHVAAAVMSNLGARDIVTLSVVTLEDASRGGGGHAEHTILWKLREVASQAAGGGNVILYMPDLPDLLKVLSQRECLMLRAGLVDLKTTSKSGVLVVATSAGKPPRGMHALLRGIASPLQFVVTPLSPPKLEAVREFFWCSTAQYRHVACAETQARPKDKAKPLWAGDQGQLTGSYASVAENGLGCACLKCNKDVQAILNLSGLENKFRAQHREAGRSTAQHQGCSTAQYSALVDEEGAEQDGDDGTQSPEAVKWHEELRAISDMVDGSQTVGNVSNNDAHNDGDTRLDHGTHCDGTNHGGTTHGGTPHGVLVSLVHRLQTLQSLEQVMVRYNPGATWRVKLVSDARDTLQAMAALTKRSPVCLGVSQCLLRDAGLSTKHQKKCRQLQTKNQTLGDTSACATSTCPTTQQMLCSDRGQAKRCGARNNQVECFVQEKMKAGSTGVGDCSTLEQELDDGDEDKENGGQRDVVAVLEQSDQQMNKQLTNGHLASVQRSIDRTDAGQAAQVIPLDPSGSKYNKCAQSKQYHEHQETLTDHPPPLPLQPSDVAQESSWYNNPKLLFSHRIDRGARKLQRRRYKLLPAEVQDNSAQPVHVSLSGGCELMTTPNASESNQQLMGVVEGNLDHFETPRQSRRMGPIGHVANGTAVNVPSNEWVCRGGAQSGESSAGIGGQERSTDTSDIQGIATSSKQHQLVQNAAQRAAHAQGAGLKEGGEGESERVVCDSTRDTRSMGVAGCGGGELCPKCYVVLNTCQSMATLCQACSIDELVVLGEMVTAWGACGSTGVAQACDYDVQALPGAECGVREVVGSVPGVQVGGEGLKVSEVTHQCEELSLNITVALESITAEWAV